jgi:hypothetical protein
MTGQSKENNRLLKTEDSGCDLFRPIPTIAWRMVWLVGCFLRFLFPHMVGRHILREGFVGSEPASTTIDWLESSAKRNAGRYNPRLDTPQNERYAPPKNVPLVHANAR